MSTSLSRGTDEALDSIVSAAVAAGTPHDVAEEARSITQRRFGVRRDWRAADPARLEAYFWGVVRRRALTGRAPAIARLLVAASLASELREAGHTPEAIARVLI